MYSLHALLCFLQDDLGRIPSCILTYVLHMQMVCQSLGACLNTAWHPSFSEPIACIHQHNYVNTARYSPQAATKKLWQASKQSLCCCCSATAAAFTAAVTAAAVAAAAAAVTPAAAAATPAAAAAVTPTAAAAAVIAAAAAVI